MYRYSMTEANTTAYPNLFTYMYIYTVNSEIIARFLLLQIMRPGVNHNNNSHFEILYMYLHPAFHQIAIIITAFWSGSSKSQ